MWDKGVVAAAEGRGDSAAGGKLLGERKTGPIDAACYINSLFPRLLRTRNFSSPALLGLLCNKEIRRLHRAAQRSAIESGSSSAPSFFSRSLGCTTHQQSSLQESEIPSLCLMFIQRPASKLRSYLLPRTSRIHGQDSSERVIPFPIGELTCGLCHDCAATIPALHASSLSTSTGILH